MDVRLSTDQGQWDAFLGAQRYRPFLQSWTMGDVYETVGQNAVRVEATENGKIIGIAFGHIVRARRGHHLSVPYGPVVADGAALPLLVDALKDAATRHGCTFLRISPFWAKEKEETLKPLGARTSPLHLLGEHVWYLPLQESDPWETVEGAPRKEEEIFKNLRATHRNLIRRAEKEGVSVEASTNPLSDIDHFLVLHEETRKRHGFTPYTDTFFRAQLERFSARGEATLYLARYQNQVIASSMHMHAFSETSYHHGASTHAYSKIPASYLLQWTAICDALKRGDRVYNFWGIAPSVDDHGTLRPEKGHPFAGVTTFKTGFPGKLLQLMHCVDIPLSKKYYLTRTFEQLRKWKRGF